MKQLQKRLVIDTSTQYLYIGLFDQQVPIDELYHSGDNDHSVTLMQQLSLMLNKHDMKPKDLNAIVVGVGPGSYTGLRIGVVVAKMLGWSLNIPVYTVSSLALMASASSVEGPILAWMDARRGHAFLGGYHLENNHLSHLQADRYAHLETFMNNLSEGAIMVHEGKPNMSIIFNSNLLQLVEDIHQLSPVYLRETEAETNLKRAQHK